MKQTQRNRRKPSTDYFSFASKLIGQLVQDGHFGTSRTYTKAISSFRSFLQQIPMPQPVELPIAEIDEHLIGRYNRFLEHRGVVRNSISFYNRVLRAIYNKAVRQLRIPDKHPFTDVYTGVDRTQSRAVSENTIAGLITFDLKQDKPLETARDLFIFSYLTRGMAFVDMAYLRKRNLKEGRIIYIRRKTGVRMEVRLESQMVRILNKYARCDSDFLLPILQGVETESPEAQYRRYQVQLALHNKQLKKLSARLRGRPALSSYVPRHSWATAARNIDISLTVISESLGHSNEQTTRIYLGTFNERLVDKANGKLLGRIKKFVSMRETNSPQMYG